MNHINTMKLALENSQPSFLTPGWTLVRNEDITALREALEEQPERPYRQLQDNGSKYFGESWDKAEQPAQGCDHCNHPLYVGTKCKNCGRLTEQAAIKRDLTPEQPAQRTWVGLTDVEWMNIVNKDQAWFGQRPDEVAHEVAKLVEAKLKEKNT